MKTKLMLSAVTTILLLSLCNCGSKRSEAREQNRKADSIYREKMRDIDSARFKN